MKVIGITGGVGTGKSEVLKYLEGKHGAVICQADLVARNLEKKNTICYRQIVEHFGDGILQENGRLDREKLAKVVFSDEEERKTLNAIVHPAVKKRILALIKEQEKKGTELFVLEAALLLEDHYDEVCDETWYIYAEDSVRRKRLKLSRGYGDERIDGIFRSQKTRDEFLNKCDRAVDNSRSFDDTCAQLESIMCKLKVS
ncbi:MAG: dephospho-CoA kinase [Dorea sp.]|jgi:dephospho-CoA kinase|nr:dephospho-CoA kinase [Dorea sp.]MCI9270961.1 dephospho-CoA kinase [Dorea sp.]